jgi:predicted DCC family thiol-disulfide oxidoreductase YuxK
MGASSLLASGKEVVFFDTDCLLCSRFVKLLLKNDRQKLCYAGFNSNIAKALLPEDLRMQPKTVLFYGDGKLLLKSKAVFMIIKRLRFPWPLFGVFVILPHTFNDAVYDWVAGNRILWFGRSNSCFLPAPDQKSRFFE